MQIRNHIMRHNGIGNGIESYCGISIFQPGQDTAVVVVTELSDNPGASITNCFERIVPRVLAAFLPLMPLKSVIWVEHYPSASRGGSPETYDLVGIEQYNGYLIPRWRPLGKEGFQQLFGSFDGKERVKIGPFPALRGVIGGINALQRGKYDERHPGY